MPQHQYCLTIKNQHLRLLHSEKSKCTHYAF